MGFKEMLEMVRNRGRRPTQQDEIDDTVTRDNYLRSLRRQRMRQMEEVEKKRLIHDIKEFNKAKTRRNMWGIRDENQDGVDDDVNPGYFKHPTQPGQGQQGQPTKRNDSWIGRGNI